MALSRKRSVSKKTSRRKSVSKKTLGSKKKTKKSVTKKTLRSKKKTSRKSVTKKTLRSKKKTSRKQKGGDVIEFTATKVPPKGTLRALGFEKERKFRIEGNRISWNDGFCDIDPQGIVQLKGTNSVFKINFKNFLSSKNVQKNPKAPFNIPCLKTKRKGMNKNCTKDCPHLVLRNIKFDTKNSRFFLRKCNEKKICLSLYNDIFISKGKSDGLPCITNRNQDTYYIDCYMEKMNPQGPLTNWYPRFITFNLYNWTLSWSHLPDEQENEKIEGCNEIGSMKVEKIEIIGGVNSNSDTRSIKITGEDNKIREFRPISYGKNLDPRTPFFKFWEILGKNFGDYKNINKKRYKQNDFLDKTLKEFNEEFEKPREKTWDSILKIDLPQNRNNNHNSSLKQTPNNEYLKLAEIILLKNQGRLNGRNGNSSTSIPTEVQNYKSEFAKFLQEQYTNINQVKSSQALNDFKKIISKKNN